MLFDYIVISCCSRFREGRSISAIYHLLKGRRSIQTVQDAHIYQLKHFYGIYPGLQKQHFDKQIHKLVEDNRLVLNNDLTAVLTDFGQNWLHKHRGNVTVQYFNGMDYYQKATVFWERLLLLIQTMTNSIKHHFHFIPVIDKPIITSWVRKQYHQLRPHQTVFLNRLYGELHHLLQCFSGMEANIFVDSLTGYHHYGMSSFQIAYHYRLKQIDVPLAKTAMVHRMLFIIGQNEATYPLLANFLRELPHESRITNSASKTKELLEKQYSAEEIAEARHLKLNTIYDHMVEIALYDDCFPLETYVLPDEQAEIMAAARKTSSYKLKDIKQEVSETISYFQIRLVLAVKKISQQGDHVDRI
ncbi:helix-turn-helix domain-containing protein [Lentibacillus sp.]|uniref:helix-turn-helix domain-containing protein n=1 Tax=Lentibacillus sp. TaxID=1925746 RepID=UPI002B4B4AD4|nr:helix-turn-helix domain-containing protein [Lentibacillus sp.]HLS08602.1 helix-turn-helix domain-containing protein [Lentibacillus sp.]